MDENLMESLDAPKFIATKDKDGMFQIFLNRPPINAFNADMVEEINRVLGNLLYRTDLKVIVFLTTAKNFCGGVAPEDFADDRSYQLIEAMGRMFEQMQTINIPVLSLVPGMALGAGFELVMFSDLAIATESATFGLPDIQLGLIPPFACNILQRYIPPKRASELILTGATITAREAQQMGLVNLVVPDDKLAEQAAVLVRKLLQFSAPVLQLAKKSMIQVQGKPLEDSIRTIEEIYLNELLGLDDSHEGIQAFVQKRKPVWKNQ
jgi:cyclohexa-1,5-dienecarbonyl-CoA hydratase